MQVTEIKSEGLSRQFKVALAAKEIEEKISRRLQEIAQTAQLPGFRPGKVPVALLRKKYGPSVMGEVLERAVNDSSMQALAEKGLRPAMQPEIEITQFEDGGDLEYTLAVELLPEIEPVDFATIELERMVMATDHAAIDDALGNLAKSRGTPGAVEGDRPAAAGDIVQIDFVGRIGGEEFPGGKATDYDLTLGSGSFIPGFEEQLIGAKAGDSVEVKVDFPDNYGAVELAGKEAVFDVTVKGLKEQRPAAIDDELAKKLGMTDLNALKNTIKEEQGREFNNIARLYLKRRLLDALADAHAFEVPEKLIENEFDAIWKQFEEEREKADDKEALNDGKTDDQHKAEFREIAERRVRLGLLLSEVGRANNVQISQEDIHRQVMAEARRYPGQEQQVMEHYKNNPQAMEHLTAPVYEEKVVDLILEKATVTDTEATLEELVKAMESDDGAAKKKAKAKTKAPAKAKDKKPAAPKDKKKAAPKDKKKAAAKPKK